LRPTAHGNRLAPDLEALDRDRQESDSGLGCHLAQRAIERAVLDHVRERLAVGDFAVEAEEFRPHHVLEPAVGDRHFPNRLRRVEPLPRADPLQEPPRAGGDRRHPIVCERRAQKCRIANRDPEARPERPRQRGRERKSRDSGTGNDDFDSRVHR
jgi:hypothetical protein